MLESFLVNINLLFNFNFFLIVFCGICAGIIFGLVPGFGGVTALALVMPFIYTMDMFTGISFLLATHASIYTAGAISAIIFGIPGSPSNSATVIDGHAFQRRGKGLYAVGASLGASVLGGLFGAFVLLLIIPILKPILMQIGSVEIFVIATFGLLSFSLLDQKNPTKVLIAVLIGIFLSTIGYQRISGNPRFWFELETLASGIPLVPLVLGLFALPEVVKLWETSNRLVESNNTKQLKLIYTGILRAIKKPILWIRSSFIGVGIGMIPGIGGLVAPFLAHTLAKKSKKFQKIDGVIAPESSNNAKEGGALIPTIALGIPGSSGMVLILVGFMILGVEAGPNFLKNHLDIAIGLSFILAFTNVITALLMIPIAIYFTKLLIIKEKYIAIFVLILVLFGTYNYANNLYDIIYLFIFGILGYIMQKYEYSRPGLILGFVLGSIIETYLHISIQAYGLNMFSRPIFILLFLFIFILLVNKYYIKRKK